MRKENLKMGDIVEVLTVNQSWADRIFIKNGFDGGIVYLDSDYYDNYKNDEEFNTRYIGSGSWRIKKQPEYVPYDIHDASELLGMKIRTKTDCSDSFIIVSLNAETKAALIFDVHGEPWFLKFDYLLENFTKLDGSPCGKLKG